MTETMQDKTRQLCEILQTAVERHMSIKLLVGYEADEKRYINMRSTEMCGTNEVEITIRDMTIRQPHCDRVHITDSCLPLLMLVDDRDQSAVIMRLPELAEEGE